VSDLAPARARPPVHDVAALEAIAIEAAAEGARVIGAARGDVPVMRMKSSRSDPVTELDLQVERTIREALRRRTPGASFLGEEHGDDGGLGDLGWVLDPIDGTVNLTYGLAAIGISLAAKLGGEVVAGVVVDIHRDEVFSAAAGRGARLDGAPLRPTAVADLADALVATGFAYSSEVRAAESVPLSRVLPAARDVRCFGSSALHLCWVACGRLDAYYQRGLKAWDYAAGALIAREAGARVQWPAEENDDLLVAASPSVFDPLLALVR
jgi:myo-inositol-1(or 4)-monophosphatase